MYTDINPASHLILFYAMVEGRGRFRKKEGSSKPEERDWFDRSSSHHDLRRCSGGKKSSKLIEIHFVAMRNTDDDIHPIYRNVTFQGPNREREEREHLFVYSSSQ
jgi:hypothetical protein